MSYTDQQKTEVLVLGSGPGGYTAAFRAADLGFQVTLVERFSVLGGVCLNVGCIPSKALLHIAKVMEEAAAMKAHGLDFGKPALDLSKIADWKNSVVKKLSTGLSALAKKRGVKVMQGEGCFSDATTIKLTNPQGDTHKITFDSAIIATGSKPIRLPFLPEDSRIMSSTGALALQDTPQELLILGGGIIGMEMAMVYHALGSKITVVEMSDMILPGVDADIIKPLYTYRSQSYQFLLNTRVMAVAAESDGVWATFEGKSTQPRQRFDRILSAVGRSPNSKHIGLEMVGIQIDERGFIPVDNQQRTNVPHIFAIGDVVGQPMLAHKATAEAQVAAEVIAGKQHYFTPRCIPSVAYTDPEIAWVGLTEIEAKRQGITVETGVFPWAASGRSLGQGRDEGRTKLLFDPKTRRILGAGIVGPNAGELIAEVALAIEMGCDAEDISLTIHPHPTLSETVKLASEMFEGTITDLISPKKRPDANQ